MPRVTPYLRFNDNKTAEAMEFYKQVFGGELEISKVSDSPMAKEMSAEAQPAVLHSVLESGDFKIFASDMIRDGETLHEGDDVSLCLTGSKAEMTELYTKLKEGGKVVTELTDAFFGMFGEVTDKFGKLWMVQADPEPQK